VETCIEDVAGIFGMLPKTVECLYTVCVCECVCECLFVLGNSVVQWVGGKVSHMFDFPG